MSEGDNNLPEQSPEAKAYYDEFFRLKSKVVILSLRICEWFYDPRTRPDDMNPEVKVEYEAVDDEFEAAVREFGIFLMKPVPD